MICQINNSHEFVNKMVEAGVITGTGDERFKVGPAKLFTDGSSTGPTIATRESYSMIVTIMAFFIIMRKKFIKC